MIEALADAQRLGFLGDRPLDEVIAHARVFTRALDDLRRSRPSITDQPDRSLRVVDLGSGGGVPGLVIADQRPEWSLTLVDRRAKRTDFLERIVTRLGWGERITVISGDATDVLRDRPQHYDAAVARGFGPPSPTLRLARGLIVPGGRIVISDPPAGDRWDGELLAELGLRHTDLVDTGGRVAVFDGFT